MHELVSISMYVPIYDRKVAPLEISAAACLAPAQLLLAYTTTALHYVSDLAALTDNYGGIGCCSVVVAR